MLSVTGFAFASPWILLGLSVLPVLWWLLRVTPPAAKIIKFPAIRLLAGLVPDEETPAKTPLWLILLRMALVSLLILAIAHPLINPSAGLPGGGPLLLVVDDGWAASHWADRQHVMSDLLGRADREGREVAILTTAAAPDTEKLTLMRPADARALVQALKPKSWPTDRAAALKRLANVPFHSATSFFLTDGLDDGGAATTLIQTLQNFGSTSVVLPEPDQVARLVTPGPPAATELTVTLRRAETGETSPVRLNAIGADGRVFGQADGRFLAGQSSVDVAFKLPSELRNRIDRIDLAGEAGAGATLLLDERSRRRPVGIVSDRPEGSQQPLLSDNYYIERALLPFAEIRRNKVAALIDGGTSMIVLPDGDAGKPEDRAKLKSWVQAGGVLLRFAGPSLAEGQDDDLLPVTLRRGDRTIGGAMSWETPAHLADFPPDSPFAGLSVPSDVTVAKQVLAEPSVDLSAKTWARLTDGTPLVTGTKLGKGWLVLVHSSANTSWTNLPLSGLFVDMLRRLGQLGQGVTGAGEGVLKPWQVLDGEGRLVAAPPTVQPIPAKSLETAKVDPTHPPGFYGSADAYRAFNLAGSVSKLALLPALPFGVTRAAYIPVPELDLRPILLGAALILLLIDCLVGYWLRGLFAGRRGAVAVGMIALFISLPAHAEDHKPPSGPDAFVIQATSELHLAYVKTGDPTVDKISHDGLVGLGAILSRRTAVETGDPIEVDVEHDELIFFPLIYWPITNSQARLSPDAVERVNRYIATGGTILFDTQDQGTSAPGLFGAGATASRLNTLLAGVHIPQLVQTPPDHVLSRSFYLLQDFPGRYDGGTLWTEPVEDRVNDGVSTVIVGSNDWAAAWATDAQGFPLYPAVPGGEQQREMAYRFGVNLVMYALTGNYKADQVHVGPILERLGQ
jgi:hypothetical protein